MAKGMTVGLARIGIGTVQFGMSYGLHNTGGRTPEEEARKILQYASSKGCLTIDTAAAYGDAEAVLGRVLPVDASFRIVTKIPPLQGRGIDTAVLADIRKGLSASLQRLGQSSVYGVLVHHAPDLLAPGGELLFQILSDARDAGTVERIGVSVYDQSQIEAVLERYDVDLVQLPFSVLDQRLLTSGTLHRLKAAGVEIHARSVFLQGLLLRSDAPAYFDPIRPRLEAWHQRVRKSGLTPEVAALSFVLGIDSIDCAILGFDTVEHLHALSGHAFGPLPFPTDDLACSDPSFVNPGNWKVR